MSRRGEDVGRFGDVDGVVTRRVKDQERLTHRRDGAIDVLGVEIVEELLADREAAAAEIDLGRAARLGLLGRRGEQRPQMRGIGRRIDGDDAYRFRHVGGHRQHRRSTETVPDQERRSPVFPTHELGGGPEVVKIGREVGVREVALGTAEAVNSPLIKLAPSDSLVL